MEFLTDSLKEVISKLSENQKEEIDVIESIVSTSETNKQSTKEKVFRFVEKRKPENCINFILKCFQHAALVRPKERESIYFLLTSVLNNFKLDFRIDKMLCILCLMLQDKNIIPSDLSEDNHIFDFAEEGTVGRAIFEDNIDSLQQLLVTQNEEEEEQIFDLEYFLRDSLFKIMDANRIELAALFGSIKCFKYLMMNGEEINERTCKFAVSGEI